MLLCDKYVSANTSTYEEFYRSFHIDATENFNFGFDVVDTIAGRSPDKLALLYTNPAGMEKHISFDEMKRQSNRAANFFLKHGIKKGDAVMLILKRNYQYWFCNVGLCKIGAIAIPATTQLMEKDVTYRNNAAGIKMIICTHDESVLQAVEGSRKDSPTLQHTALANGQREGWLDLDDELSQCSDIFERPTGELATRNSDPMLIYFTSGTTGFPKMAMHDFLYPLGHITTARYWHTNGPDGLHLTISDTGWAKAGWGKIYGQWLSECAIFVYDFDRFDPKEILAIIEKYRITTFCAPPTMYRMLTQEDVASCDLSSLTHCCSAGEALNPEVFHDWKKGTGLAIYEGFGQSETTCCLATFPGMPIKIGAMGRPVPGYDIVLLDEDGQECKPGERGEICIRVNRGKPLGLFNGYYREKSLTDKVWHDGAYHTGDTAWQDEEGYYWYVGRVDDIIKSSGYRIGPFEVESALMEHAAVLEAAVTGAPDPVRGQIVKATVVLKPGNQPSDDLVKELQNHVKHVTAPYKYPRIIEFVESLPKTVSGKIKRAQIRQANG